MWPDCVTGISRHQARCYYGGLGNINLFLIYSLSVLGDINLRSNSRCWFMYIGTGKIDREISIFIIPSGKLLSCSNHNAYIRKS